MTTYTAPLTNDRIQAALPLMNERDAATVNSILNNAERWGSMTPKQAALVAMLVARTERAERGSLDKVDLSKINEMFATAGKELKRPFVCFLVEGAEYRVSKAPETGRNPGCLYVKQSGTYAGKIGPTGDFSASREAPASVYTALLAFAANPVKAAHAYGMETGACCFCARELTDARSVTVGYGPICASRWGLPWGE